MDSLMNIVNQLSLLNRKQNAGQTLIIKITTIESLKNVAKFKCFGTTN